MANPPVDAAFPRDPLGGGASPSSSSDQSSEGGSFWRHKSLDELIAEQGVQPIEDFQGFLDEIGDVWPEEESVDEFIAWLAETRRMG
jgi:hypothetical protein